MEEKYIEAFTKLLEDPINSKVELDALQSKATNLLTRIYGENSKQADQVNNIRFQT